MNKAPTERPSAEDIVKLFNEFDSYFWHSVGNNKREYMKASTDVKNQVFAKTYEKYVQLSGT